MYIVYMYKNKNNNKIYIGQTSQNKKRREGANAILYKHSPYFYSAIQKYGLESFEYFILKENLSYEEANYYEKYYISLYNSNNSIYGYNLTCGGQKFKFTDDAKQKISQGMKNSKIFYKHNRESHKKAIMYIDLDTYEYEIFDAIVDVEKKYNYSHGTISSCCKNISRSYKNKIWRYYKQDDEYKIKQFIQEYYQAKNSMQNLRKQNISKTQRLRLSKIAIKYNERPVLQYSLDDILLNNFKSISEAALYTGINPSSISAVCHNRRKTAGKYKWKFKNLS